MADAAGSGSPERRERRWRLRCGKSGRVYAVEALGLRGEPSGRIIEVVPASALEAAEAERDELRGWAVIGKGAPCVHSVHRPEECAYCRYDFERRDKEQAEERLRTAVEALRGAAKQACVPAQFAEDESLCPEYLSTGDWCATCIARAALLSLAPDSTEATDG